MQQNFNIEAITVLVKHDVSTSSAHHDHRHSGWAAWTSTARDEILHPPRDAGHTAQEHNLSIFSTATIL